MTDTEDNKIGTENAEREIPVEELDETPDTGYSVDDVQFEDIEDEQNPTAVLKKLREKLRKCEVEKKEYLDGWQRMRADFTNARKDEEARRGELIKFASEGLVEDLLPVLDSFGMAFANKEAWEKIDANWRKGVEYIHSQMLSVLESRGLTEIGAVGEKVDPRLHIAVEGIPVDDVSKVDTVIEVMQKGYRLHSKVIRPANVKGGIAK